MCGLASLIGGQRGIDSAALRPCGVRFAEGMVFSLVLEVQSNPVLCRSPHPSLAEMEIRREMSSEVLPFNKR